MSENMKKRVTVVFENPNPLFEKWLIEWKEDAKRRGSKMERTFNFALSNLRKFPIPLASGQDCKILRGFGDKLCKMLDDKLTEYNLTRGNHCQKVTTPNKQIKAPKLKSPNSHKKEYAPKYKSGGYAILTTLYRQWPGSLSKDEIIHLGKHLSDTSFLKPDPGSYYTAWSSMKTLQEKGLVIKKGKPIKYSLTDTGYSLAEKLAANHPFEMHEPVIEKSPTYNLNTEVEKVNKSNEDNTGNTISEKPETLIFPNQENEVIDVIDECEDNLQEYLSSNAVELEVDIDLGNNIKLPNVQTLQKIITLPNCENISKPSFSLSTFGSNSKSSQNLDLNDNSRTIKKSVTADTVLTSKNCNSKCLGKSNFKKCSSSGSIQSIQNSVEHEQFIFEPNSFDVILYVDVRETAG